MYYFRLLVYFCVMFVIFYCIVIAYYFLFEVTGIHLASLYDTVNQQILAAIKFGISQNKFYYSVIRFQIFRVNRWT